MSGLYHVSIPSLTQHRVSLSHNELSPLSSKARRRAEPNIHGNYHGIALVHADRRGTDRRRSDRSFISAYKSSSPLSPIHSRSTSSPARGNYSESSAKTPAVLPALVSVVSHKSYATAFPPISPTSSLSSLPLTTPRRGDPSFSESLTNTPPTWSQRQRSQQVPHTRTKHPHRPTASHQSRQDYPLLAGLASRTHVSTHIISTQGPSHSSDPHPADTSAATQPSSASTLQLRDPVSLRTPTNEPPYNSAARAHISMVQNLSPTVLAPIATNTTTSPVPTAETHLPPLITRSPIPMDKKNSKTSRSHSLLHSAGDASSVVAVVTHATTAASTPLPSLTVTTTVLSPSPIVTATPPLPAPGLSKAQSLQHTDARSRKHHSLKTDLPTALSPLFHASKSVSPTRSAQESSSGYHTGTSPCQDFPEPSPSVDGSTTVVSRAVFRKSIDSFLPFPRPLSPSVFSVESAEDTFFLNDDTIPKQNSNFRDNSPPFGDLERQAASRKPTPTSSSMPSLPPPSFLPSALSLPPYMPHTGFSTSPSPRAHLSPASSPRIPIPVPIPISPCASSLHQSNAKANSIPFLPSTSSSSPLTPDLEPPTAFPAPSSLAPPHVAKGARSASYLQERRAVRIPPRPPIPTRTPNGSRADGPQSHRRGFTRGMAVPRALRTPSTDNCACVPSVASGFLLSGEVTQEIPDAVPIGWATPRPDKDVLDGKDPASLLAHSCARGTSDHSLSSATLQLPQFSISTPSSSVFLSAPHTNTGASADNGSRVTGGREISSYTSSTSAAAAPITTTVHVQDGCGTSSSVHTGDTAHTGSVPASLADADRLPVPDVLSPMSMRLRAVTDLLGGASICATGSSREAPHIRGGVAVSASASFNEYCGGLRHDTTTRRGSGSYRRGPHTIAPTMGDAERAASGSFRGGHMRVTGAKSRAGGRRDVELSLTSRRGDGKGRAGAYGGPALSARTSGRTGHKVASQWSDARQDTTTSAQTTTTAVFRPLQGDAGAGQGSSSRRGSLHGEEAVSARRLREPWNVIASARKGSGHRQRDSARDVGPAYLRRNSAVSNSRPHSHRDLPTSSGYTNASRASARGGLGGGGSSRGRGGPASRRVSPARRHDRGSRAGLRQGCVLPSPRNGRVDASGVANVCTVAAGSSVAEVRGVAAGESGGTRGHDGVSGDCGDDRDGYDDNCDGGGAKQYTTRERREDIVKWGSTRGRSGKSSSRHGVRHASRRDHLRRRALSGSLSSAQASSHTVVITSPVCTPTQCPSSLLSSASPSLTPPSPCAPSLSAQHAIPPPVPASLSIAAADGVAIVKTAPVEVDVAVDPAPPPPLPISADAAIDTHASADADTDLHVGSSSMSTAPQEAVAVASANITVIADVTEAPASAAIDMSTPAVTDADSASPPALVDSEQTGAGALAPIEPTTAADEVASPVDSTVTLAAEPLYPRPGPSPSPSPFPPSHTTPCSPPQSSPTALPLPQASHHHHIHLSPRLGGSQAALASPSHKYRRCSMPILPPSRSHSGVAPLDGPALREERGGDDAVVSAAEMGTDGVRSDGEVDARGSEGNNGAVSPADGSADKIRLATHDNPESPRKPDTNSKPSGSLFPETRVARGVRRQHTHRTPRKVTKTTRHNLHAASRMAPSFHALTPQHDKTLFPPRRPPSPLRPPVFPPSSTAAALLSMDPADELSHHLLAAHAGGPLPLHERYTYSHYMHPHAHQSADLSDEDIDGDSAARTPLRLTDIGSSPGSEAPIRAAAAYHGVHANSAMAVPVSVSGGGDSSPITAANATSSPAVDAASMAFPHRAVLAFIPDTLLRALTSRRAGADVRVNGPHQTPDMLNRLGAETIYLTPDATAAAAVLAEIDTTSIVVAPADVEASVGAESGQAYPIPASVGDDHAVADSSTTTLTLDTRNPGSAGAPAARSSRKLFTADADAPAAALSTNTAVGPPTAASVIVTAAGVCASVCVANSGGVVVPDTVTMCADGDVQYASAVVYTHDNTTLLPPPHIPHASSAQTISGNHGLQIHTENSAHPKNSDPYQHSLVSFMASTVYRSHDGKPDFDSDICSNANSDVDSDICSATGSEVKATLEHSSGHIDDGPMEDGHFDRAYHTGGCPSPPSEAGFTHFAASVDGTEVSAMFASVIAPEPGWQLLYGYHSSAAPVNTHYSPHNDACAGTIGGEGATQRQLPSAGNSASCLPVPALAATSSATRAPIPLQVALQQHRERSQPLTYAPAHTVMRGHAHTQIQWLADPQFAPEVPAVEATAAAALLPSMHANISSAGVTPGASPRSWMYQTSCVTVTVVPHVCAPHGYTCVQLLLPPPLARPMLHTATTVDVSVSPSALPSSTSTLAVQTVSVPASATVPLQGDMRSVLATDTSIAASPGSGTASPAPPAPAPIMPLQVHSVPTALLRGPGLSTSFSPLMTAVSASASHPPLAPSPAPLSVSSDQPATRLRLTREMDLDNLSLYGHGHGDGNIDSHASASGDGRDDKQASAGDVAPLSSSLPLQAPALSAVPADRDGDRDSDCSLLTISSPTPVAARGHAHASSVISQAIPSPLQHPSAAMPPRTPLAACSPRSSLAARPTSGLSLHTKPITNVPYTTPVQACIDGESTRTTRITTSLMHASLSSASANTVTTSPANVTVNTESSASAVPGSSPMTSFTSNVSMLSYAAEHNADPRGIIPHADMHGGGLLARVEGPRGVWPKTHAAMVGGAGVAPTVVLERYGSLSSSEKPAISQNRHFSEITPPPSRNIGPPQLPYTPFSIVASQPKLLPTLSESLSISALRTPAPSPTAAPSPSAWAPSPTFPAPALPSASTPTLLPSPSLPLIAPALTAASAACSPRMLQTTIRAPHARTPTAALSTPAGPSSAFNPAASPVLAIAPTPVLAETTPSFSTNTPPSAPTNISAAAPTSTALIAPATFPAPVHLPSPVVGVLPLQPAHVRTPPSTLPASASVTQGATPLFVGAQKGACLVLWPLTEDTAPGLSLALHNALYTHVHAHAHNDVYAHLSAQAHVPHHAPFAAPSPPVAAAQSSHRSVEAEEYTNMHDRAADVTASMAELRNFFFEGSESWETMFPIDIPKYLDADVDVESLRHRSRAPSVVADSVALQQYQQLWNALCTPDKHAHSSAGSVASDSKATEEAGEGWIGDVEANEHHESAAAAKYGSHAHIQPNVHAAAVPHSTPPRATTTHATTTHASLTREDSASVVGGSRAAIAVPRPPTSPSIVMSIDGVGHKDPGTAFDALASREDPHFARDSPSLSCPR